MLHAQNTPFLPKTHPITSRTLYIHSALAYATFNCIIMLMSWMSIHFQLAVIAPKGSPKEKRKVSARAKKTVIGYKSTPVV
jgi:hypothetical protein